MQSSIHDMAAQAAAAASGARVSIGSVRGTSVDALMQAADQRRYATSYSFASGGAPSAAPAAKSSQLVPTTMLQRVTMLEEDRANLAQADKVNLGQDYYATPAQAAMLDQQNREANIKLRVLGSYASPTDLLMGGGPLQQVTQDMVADHLLEQARGRGKTEVNLHRILGWSSSKRPLPSGVFHGGSLADTSYLGAEFGSLASTCRAASTPSNAQGSPMDLRAMAARRY